MQKLVLPILRHIFSGASAANSSVAFGYSGVFGRKQMSAMASNFIGFFALHIFLFGNRLQMARVNTRWIPAQMVKFNRAIKRTIEKLPVPAMGISGGSIFSMFANPELAVSTFIFLSNPLPTGRIKSGTIRPGFINFGQESFNDRFSLSAHMSMLPQIAVGA